MGLLKLRPERMSELHMMPWWDHRLAFVALFVVVLLTLAVKGGQVEWQAVPDGPDTYAVIKDYGSEPEWSIAPYQPSREQTEQRICNGVPSEQDAQRIARLLNESK